MSRTKQRRKQAAQGSDELWLAEIPLRETVELVRIDLPHDQMEPLLELGLMPGCRLCPVRRSPFGDPVLMVDGSLMPPSARSNLHTRVLGDGRWTLPPGRSRGGLEDFRRLFSGGPELLGRVAG